MRVSYWKKYVIIEQLLNLINKSMFRVSVTCLKILWAAKINQAENNVDPKLKKTI